MHRIVLSFSRSLTNSSYLSISRLHKLPQRMMSDIYVPVCTNAVETKCDTSDTRPVIAVDVDEVLAQFVNKLIEYHNATYNTSLIIADFHSYHFRDVWGGTNEESQAKVEAFLSSPYFSDLPVVSGAYDTLVKYKSLFRFEVVTSRQLFLQETTNQWINTHFPDIFSALHFGNHYGSQGAKVSKGELCQSIGAVALIDDSSIYADECSQLLPNVILFNLDESYPWSNLRKNLAENVLKAGNWSDVDGYLSDIANKV